MEIAGWKYYNHAALPACAPHETADTTPIENGSIWKIGGRALLARWTSDFDCGHETEWWYVIKDSPLDMESLKSKRRYEIKKGKKNFEVREINPADYLDELYRTAVAAISAYPEKYRPTVERDSFQKYLLTLKNVTMFAAFHRERGTMEGYAILINRQTYLSFEVLKTNPESERLGVNAALVAGMLEAVESELKDGVYISDGSRAIRHETAFQDYLEKYFGFRKAYCTLHIRYRIGVGLCVRALYPFRRFISRESGLGSQISSVLQMEEIRRSFL